jgi:hypothetical protein
MSSTGRRGTPQPNGKGDYKAIQASVNLRGRSEALADGGEAHPVCYNRGPVMTPI